tara:strand:+ start:716 stop:895 length:180 start_codon:yes stop_codon:yes gene_type:complete
MRKADYNYLSQEIKKAEHYLAFYEGLTDGDYSKDIYFWKGYLNAVELSWLQSKNNYKII